MRLNDVGDLVLDDPEAIRALADPARLTLLDGLRRSGPATVDELGDDADAHLVQLERHGFVTRDESDPPRWTAVGNGIFFEIPDDPAGQSAARELTKVMLVHYDDLPRRWVAESEPLLTVDWARAAGLFNARVTLTPGELEQVQAGLEAVLMPFLNRAPGDAPDEATSVRVLAYFLPEPSPAGRPA